MLNEDYTTKLLDLEEVIIKNVEIDAKSTKVTASAYIGTVAAALG